jgi:N-acetylmuramoyl-L-alanine amidase CwlD
MVNAAIYTRLSHEDEAKQDQESESIQNQKAMLSDYCRERNWNIYDIYCDEDYSGIDSTRPDFNRMLADCERDCIDVVLCKSQSRFSRDMEVIEKYIHNKFLEWNVRFISIVDRADSHDIANKKARQINGLINEWYLEDTSENIRKTLDNKRKRGEFTGSFAPFGYQVNPKNKNHLLIDSYAANIVRDIFDWYLQGWGYRKIVMQLNQSAIPCPTLYKQNQNSRYVNPNSQTASKCLWTQSTIYNIIRNENYTGTLVQGKSHFVSYKNRKKKAVPKADWVRVPDCHEAIIDPPTWTKTQDKLAGKIRACRTTQKISPLSGLVKCTVCGKPMKRNVYYNKARTIQYYNLTCGTYKVGAMNCRNTASISGLQLESALIAQINSWISDYCSLDKIEIKSEHDLKIARLNIDLEMLQSTTNKKIQGLSYLSEVVNIILQNTTIMRLYFMVRRNKLPLTIAFLVCFLVITLTFNANNMTVPAGGGVEGRPVIILDAGHGGMDGGAVGVHGELEKHINLAVVKNLQQLLEFSGYNVILTRDSDRSMHTEGVTGIRNQKVSDMENRRAIIDANQNSLFFSIHQNRFTDPSLTGAQMFHTPLNAENQKLAQILQDGFAELQPGNEREIKVIDNDLFLFKDTTQPAVLIECGFMSNAQEVLRLNCADYQKKIAFTIYRGIMEYLAIDM